MKLDRDSKKFVGTPLTKENNEGINMIGPSSRPIAVFLCLSDMTSYSVTKYQNKCDSWDKTLQLAGINKGKNSLLNFNISLLS